MAAGCTTRILWVGAERPGASLRSALDEHCCTVLRSEPGDHACQAARRLQPQAVLLAPGPKGLDSALASLGRLRAALPRAAMAVLLPALRPIDEVRLLDGGADLCADAVHSSLLLMARLRQALRRATECAPGVAAPLRLGRVELDERTERISVDGRTLELSGAKASLLHALVRRNGLPVGRGELAHSMGLGPEQGRSVDMAVSRLRQVLRAEGVRELAIQSVYRQGYRLVVQPLAAPPGVGA
jgi:DNA-binding response OmpR family regulator